MPNAQNLIRHLRGYPATVSEVLDKKAKYKPEVLAALREFRAAKPWQGTVAERKEKFRALHQKLCAAYGILCHFTFDVPEVEAKRGNGWCATAPDGYKHICLVGKLSVVTYLHEFAHAVFGAVNAKPASGP